MLKNIWKNISRYKYCSIFAPKHTIMSVAFIQVLSMFGIAFTISMFVAFIIKFIYKLLTSKSLSRLSDNKEMAIYKRARRINKIHDKKIFTSMQETEYYKSNELLNYYYNKNNILKNA